jgi:hypothetical protein
VPLDVEILMDKPFEVINFLKVLVFMLLVFIALQAAVIWPASRYVARVKGLPATTRVVSGEITIDNVNRVSGTERTLEAMVSEHRNLGADSAKARLTQVIRGFTLKGFPSLVYKGLFKPRRVPVFIKRSLDNPTELTVGQGGYEILKEATWGLVSPKLNGVWAISFNESDVRMVRENPNRVLRGQLLYILPAESKADASTLANDLTVELEKKGFRDLMPKLFDQAKTARASGRDKATGDMGSTSEQKDRSSEDSDNRKSGARGQVKPTDEGELYS